MSQPVQQDDEDDQDQQDMYQVNGGAHNQTHDAEEYVNELIEKAS